MSKNLDVSLSIKLKQTDAKNRIAEIGQELQKIGANTAAPAREVERLRQKLLGLRDAAKLDSARNIIGIQPFRDVQREIDRVNAAFGRLKSSGKLSASELGQAYLKTKERIEELKGSMNGIGSYFEQIRGQALALAAQLAVFGLAAREAIVFEDALVDLRRAANTTAEETETMGKGIKDLAEDLGLSAVAVAKLATAAAKAGIAKGDLLEFARIAATAAMNFDMIPEEAGDSLAKLKNIFGLAIGDMEAFVATINELADNAAASERDVIEALKLGGGSARLFGLDPKQSAALATGFLNVGATAEQAGTAMRTLLDRLAAASRGSGQAGKALQGVVGDTREFAQLLAGDANGALNVFLRALSKVPTAARAAAMKEIFQEGLDTNNIAKLTNDLGKFEEVAAHAAKSNEELVNNLRELTKMKLGSTQSELDLMATAWRNAGQAVGELFLPAIRGVTIALGALAQAIRYLAEEIPQLTRLAVVFGTLAVGWGAFRGMATVAIAVLGKLGINIAAVGTASGLLSSLWGRMISVFGSVLTALRSGTGVFAALRGALAVLFGPVILKAIGMFRSLTSMAGFAWAAFRGGAGVIAALRVALGGLMGPVGWVITGLSLLAAAWDFFSGSGNDAKAALEKQRKAFDGVEEALRNVGAAAAETKNQIDVAMQNASAPIEALVGDYKTASEEIKLALDRRLQVIDEAAKREQQIVDNSNLSQRTKANETARIAAEAEQKKVQAIDDAGRQMLSSWERTYGAAMRIEREAGITGSQLAKDAVDAKLGIYQQLEGAYRKTIDALINEEQRHLRAAREAENQRLMFKMNVQDKMRALSQKTMSDEQAYADRVKQIDEKIAKAREASAQGQSEAAKRYIDEAISLAQSNANAVTKTVEQGGKDVTQTVVTLEQAVQTSQRQIQEAAKIMDADLANTATTAQTSADKAKGQLGEAQSKLDEVMAGINELRQQKAVEIEAKLAADEQSATAAIATLQRLADAQAVHVQLELDLQAAKDALATWKDQPENEDLKLAATVAQETLANTTADLRAKMTAANLQAPVGLDTAPAAVAMETLVTTLNDTQTSSQHSIDDNSFETMGNLEALNNHDTSSVHTIYVQRVEMDSAGGLVGAYARGGLIQRLADGGRAFRRMVGRISGPGTSTSDSIPALLSNGEYVIKASSVRKFGEGFFAALNAGFLPPMPRFAEGGAVSTPIVPGSAWTGTVLFRVGEKEVPLRVSGPDGRSSVESLVGALNRYDLVGGR
jgi:TP901 family phage tail tape measure protein